MTHSNLLPNVDGLTLDHWLFGHVCPFWMDAVVAENGGFYESLDADGKTVQGNERTVLNQARLTYVFSHAYCLRPTPQLLASAQHGFTFLLRAQDIAGTGNGWQRMVSVDGNVIDATRDAYDQAFVIFSMAWYYRATGNPDALMLADRAYQFMQEHLQDHQYGGFFEEFPFKEGVQKLPRRQNPHMHLLEATLAMFEATRLPQWLERSQMLVELFKKYFFDSHSGSLAEYFNGDWSIAAHAAGALREPGHQFEWVWLLHEYARHSGDQSVKQYAQRLFIFGTAHGIDDQGPLQGMVFDGVDTHGSLVAESKLLWPQTEYIKACIACAQWFDDSKAKNTAILHVERMCQHFFKPDGASWYNQLSRSGVPLQRATPSRVLYHLFLSMAEVLRFTSPKVASTG
jgi:mannose/cellobiose epimerase-like protein (N-acyl-D-glucosamine 2-epimerase family)